MIKMSSTRIYQLILSFSLWQTCFSLECYTCSSQLDPMGTKTDCEKFWYNGDEKYKTTHCPNIDSVCAKYIVEYDGNKWVHRSCQSPNICSRLNAKFNDNKNILLECDTCADRNLCNSSTLHLASIFLMIIFISVLGYMK